MHFLKMASQKAESDVQLELARRFQNRNVYSDVGDELHILAELSLDRLIQRYHHSTLVTLRADSLRQRTDNVGETA